MEILISGKYYLLEPLRKSIYSHKYIGKDDIRTIHNVCVSHDKSIKLSTILNFVFKQGGIPVRYKKSYDICLKYIRSKNKFYLNFIRHANTL